MVPDELKVNVYLDTDIILDVFQKLGPKEVAMYVLLQSVNRPISLAQLAGWSGLTEDHVTSLCSRLGMLQLGIDPPEAYYRNV